MKHFWSIFEVLEEHFWMILIDWEGLGGRKRVNCNFEIGATKTRKLAPRKQAKCNFEIGGGQTSELEGLNFDLERCAFKSSAAKKKSRCEKE